MCTKHGLILFHELEELAANKAKEKAVELEAADGKALPRPPASTEGEGDGARGAPRSRPRPRRTRPTASGR